MLLTVPCRKRYGVSASVSYALETSHITKVASNLGSVDPNLLPPDLRLELVKYAAKVHRNATVIEVETKGGSIHGI